MKIGTKSVLFGAHCFFLHPWFVAAAWWKLNGFPWDPRLWVAFFVHDIGYLGKPNMDGEEGELHPMTGADICGKLFDHQEPNTFLSRWRYVANIIGPICNWIWGRDPQGVNWYCFCFYHSRFLAKRYGVIPSRLCPADKLSICLTPAWLYLPMVRWSGEIHEYMKLAESGKYDTMNIPTSAQLAWYRGVQEYLRRWVAEHRGGNADTWTPERPCTHVYNSQKENLLITPITLDTPKPKLIYNSGRCLVCMTELESKHTYDYVRCKCGAQAIDGGLEYARRIGNPLDRIELSRWETS